MVKLLLPLLLLMGVLILAIASDRPLPRADFTFINKGDVSTLDLQRISWLQDMRAGRLLFEGLVAHDVFHPDYRLIPAAAERWEISPDGTRYTFHLRKDARWSNGSPLRASDFVYAWRRLLLPDTGGDYTRQMQLVKGGEAFFQWRLQALRDAAQGTGPTGTELWDLTLKRFTDTVGIRALDDHTLEVELERHTPYFLDLCAMVPFYPVYPPLVSQFERVELTSGRLIIESGWTKPGQLINNGPFILTHWRFKRDMRLQQNPEYWNRAALNIRTIAIPTVDDANAMVLAFRAGAADWVTDVVAPYRGDMVQQKLAYIQENRPLYDTLKAQGYDEIEIARRMPDDPRNHLHILPVFGTFFYNFNCNPRLADGRPNPFADPRVRRALALVIDKEAITRDVRRVGEPVARTLIPPGSLAGYNSPTGLTCISDAKNPEERQFIIDQARALLSEAGYPNPSSDLPTITMLFNKDGGHDLIAQAIAKDWQRTLGLSVILEQKELKVFREDLKNQNYMTSRGGWYGDYGDPTTFLDIHRTGDDNNDRAYSSETYDNLLKQAAEEPDNDLRLNYLSLAERHLVEEDLPVIPIYHYCNIYLFNAHNVSGINAHPRQTQNLFLIDILTDDLGTNRPLSTPPTPPTPPTNSTLAPTPTQPTPDEEDPSP
jgi:oligopeptide transport system substrate-binding protein